MKPAGLAIVVIALTGLVFAASNAAGGTVTIGAEALTGIAQTPVQEAFGEYIGLVCANGVLDTGTVPGKDLQDRCDNMVLSVLTGRQSQFPLVLNGVDNTADDEHPTTRRTLQAAGGDVRLGGAAGGAGARLVSYGGPGAFEWSSGAAGDGERSPWNFFVKGLYAYSKQDATDIQVGFDSDDFGLSAGLDYSVSDSFLLGAAVTYRNIDAQIDDNGGSLESDSYSVYAFGSYSPNTDWYLDGAISYGWADHDQKRNVAYQEPDAGLGTATVIHTRMLSNTDSGEFAANLTGGYNFRHQSWLINPYARIDGSDTKIDAFSETPTDPDDPGAGLALAVDDQNFNSLTASLGLAVTLEVAKNGIGRLFPYIFAEYVHEFQNDNDPVTGKFVSDPADSGFRFRLPTEEPDRDYMNLGIGIAASFTDSVLGFARYEALVGYQDLAVHAVEVGVSWTF